MPVWQRVATVHRLGFGRRISLSSAVARLRQPDGQCATGARWLTGTRDRSALRRFLSAAFDQLAAPDLVLGDGGEPAAARPAGIGSFRARAPPDLGSACSRRLAPF